MVGKWASKSRGFYQGTRGSGLASPLGVSPRHRRLSGGKARSASGGLSLVDREAAGQGMDLGTHGRDVGLIAWVVQHIGNQVGRRTCFLILEAAGGHGGRANTHTAGDHRL